MAQLGYEVLDARPGDAVGWLAGDDLPEHDLLVLDLEDPGFTQRVLTGVKDRFPSVRALVVSDGSTGWLVSELAADATLQRPLVDGAVAAAVRSLVPPEPAGNPVAPLTGSADDAPASATVPPPVLSEAPAIESSAVPSLDPGILERAAEVARHALTLADVASLVAAAAADRLEADAAALLIPDGDTWRVAGSAGLRPMETRLTLDHDHWVVRELMQTEHGAVVDHSDVARAHLVNAPVAAHEYVLVATEPVNRSALLVGRASAPFTPPDVDVAKSILAEAADHLRDAVKLRELAREMLRFVDLEQW